MKIIQVVDNLGVGGGVNSFVFDLSEALVEKGCDVSLIGILAFGYEKNSEINRLRDKGIRIECIRAANKKDALLHNVGRLRKVIADISCGEDTVCNLHLKLSVLMGVFATRKLKNIKCIETYHNTYHHYHLQCWLCSPFIKKYICVSETAKEEMHHRFRIPYSKLVAIPNGVSRNRIRESAEIEAYKSEKGKLRIVSVGRLSYEKNFVVPVKAFTTICNKDITYTLVGGGPQANEIETIASQNAYICLTGPLNRKEALHELAKADIVVMPSLWEGRSILQLEAMALDKPMIISNAAGLREPFNEKPLTEGELYRKCNFGFLVETNSPKAYLCAVENVILEGKNSLEKARSKVQAVSLCNDISAVADKYKKIYRDT